MEKLTHFVYTVYSVCCYVEQLRLKQVSSSSSPPAYLTRLQQWHHATKNNNHHHYIIVVVVVFVILGARFVDFLSVGNGARVVVASIVIGEK